MRELLKKSNKSIAVSSAKYLFEYTLQITFNNGVIKNIDFTPFLNEISVPEYKKYLLIEEFKKFKIEGGNIVWGEDWDLIYSIDTLLNA